MPQNIASQPTTQGTFATTPLATATPVKATPGRVFRVMVLVPGSTTGSINNAATVAAVAAGNLIAVVPNTVGTYNVEAPCTAGIVFTPGTGMTAVVTFS